MTDQEAVEIFRKAVVQPDGGLVAQVLPNAWVKLQFTTAMCASPKCRAEEHDESEYTIYQNQHFITHDVVAIEVKKNFGDGRIRVRAHTTEGDACEGMAEAVLRRLSEPALGQTIAPPHVEVSEPVVDVEPKKSWFNLLFGG